MYCIYRCIVSNISVLTLYSWIWPVYTNLSVFLSSFRFDGEHLYPAYYIPIFCAKYVTLLFFLLRVVHDLFQLIFRTQNSKANQKFQDAMLNGVSQCERKKKKEKESQPEVTRVEMEAVNLICHFHSSVGINDAIMTSAG